MSKLALVLNQGFVRSAIFSQDNCKIFSESNTGINNTIKPASTCRGYDSKPMQCSTEMN